MTNFIKKLSLSIVACLIFTAIHAQTNEAVSVDQKVETEVNNLKNQLSLTKEQTAKVHDVILRAEQKRAYSTDNPGNIDAYVRSEFNEILTPSQMNVYVRMQEMQKVPTNTNKE